MAFSLRNLARGIKDDLNLWDNGKSHGNNQSNPPPASTAQAKSSFKPLNNSVTRGLSRSIDQVNPFDNGRTWQQTTPTNNSSFIQQGANLVKPIVKPFTETADFAQQQTKLGLLNATGGGNTDYANQVRAGRDESYQQSLVPMASRTYNRLSEVPIVGDVIAPGKRQAATANENKIKQVQTQIDSVVQPKVAEIQQGIKSGIYDRQKGAEAIQQLMETSMIPSQMLQDSYNQKLQSAGFDQNTSKAQMFGATAGDLANLASFAVAPASGQALSSMVANQGLKQAVKIGGTDLLANGLLGGVGAGTSALGQGANWQDALKAGGTGVALNTALMGAGYIKGIHQGTANTIAGKASPTINGVKPTTKLIKPLDENGSFRVPFTKGEPGDTLFNIQNPDGARMSKPLNVQDQFNSSSYQPPIKKTSRVQIETPGPRPDKSLSGAALQSKLSKDPGAVERRMVQDYLDMEPPIKGSALSGEGAQLPPKPGEVVNSVDPVTKKITSKRLFKPMDEVGGAKIGDIPGLNKVAQDPLYSLKQEARKYKSAEEFKQALTSPDVHRGGMLPNSYLKTPKKLYRGVSSDGSGVGSAGEGLGLYTTTDKKTAMGYAKNGGKLLEMNPATDIPTNPLYFRNPDAVRSWVAGVAQKMGMRVPEFNEKVGIENLVNSLGHDGVAFDLGNGTAYAKYANNIGVTDGQTISKISSKTNGLRPKNKDGIQFDKYTGEILLDGKRNIPPEFIEVKQGSGWQALTDKQTKPKKSLFKPLDSEGSAQVGGPLLPIPKKLVEKLSNKGKGRWEDKVVGDNTFRVYKETPIVGKKQSSFAKGVTKSNEISPELQAKVKAQDTTYTPTNNTDQAKVSKTLVNKGYKKAATDVTSRLEVKTGKINAQDVADTIHVIKELDKRGGEANLQQATMLSEKLSEHLTKAGQTIQASSILNNRTPEGMAYGARKFLKSHNIEVTPEIQKVIKTQVDEIAKLKPGEARNYKIAELQQKISTYVPSSTLEKAVGLWKAGLLTGIKTQTGNTLSGVATNVLKTASDAVAAPIDAGFSALGKTELGKKMGFTGERSKSFTMRGKGSGVVEGAQKGWKSLKTGIDERNIEANKFDTKRLVFSNSIAGKVAQKYTDGVYGLMGAADRPNYYSNLRNNLYDLAITDAKNKGLKGPAREAHIQKFIKEPPMKALETANQAADVAIFGNDTALSRIAGGVISSAEKAGPVVGTAAKVALPFTKVPSAVATRLVDYSPFGAVKTIAEQIKNVKKGGVLDQRALSEGLSQSLTGTGTMWLGAQLHNNGLMTGSYPTDKKEQELWKLEGKQPNSIKIGGKWQSFNYTSPIGQVLAIGGKINEAKQKGAGVGGQLTAGAFAIPKTVSDQSFLQGINGIQDAINDPEKQGSKFIKSQTASVIPTLSADIAKATDSKQRQSNNVKEALQAKIPGLNQKLLPKQDAFGGAIPRASSSVNTLVNPLRPSDVRPTNDLNTELRRLQDQKLGVMPDSTDKQLKFGKETINLNPQQLFDKNTQVGKKTQDTWNAIIKTPEYQKMTDEQKQKALSNSLSDIKALYKGDFAVQNDSRLLDSNKLNKNQIKLSQGDASSYLKTKTSTKTTVAEDEKAYEYRKTSSKNSLDMSRALNNNDISQYMSAAKNELDALERLKKSYDPKTEQDKINSTIKKQESLQNKVDKYNDKGYLKKTSKSGKGSKGKKGKFDYSKRLVSGTASTSALRNIVKGIKISRKRITK